MILTEEQREAIRAVSDLPRAIGCTRCHNYIQKNYSNQFAVLRSMIDNSDHIVGPDELIGFERAKDARIKELEADLEQSEICIQARLDVIEQLQAENEELQESLTDAYLLGSHKKAKELAPRIKALENALVEERTCTIRCESYDHCEGMYRIDLPDAMIRAQQELQAEGKIGPDAETGNRDHVVGPDQMIPNGKVWPIAEELRHCTSCGKSIEEIKGNLCKGDYFIGSIFIDPGQEGSRYDPPIEASYYFSCCDCSRSWQITEERVAALQNAITLFGVVHPTKDEPYQCDVGHMEIFPEEHSYDILSDALAKFSGKRVKITIVEV